MGLTASQTGDVTHTNDIFCSSTTLSPLDHLSLNMVAVCYGTGPTLIARERWKLICFSKQQLHCFLLLLKYLLLTTNPYYILNEKKSTYSSYLIRKNIWFLLVSLKILQLFSQLFPALLPHSFDCLQVYVADLSLIASLEQCTR